MNVFNARGLFALGAGNEERVAFVIIGIVQHVADVSILGTEIDILDGPACELLEYSKIAGGIVGFKAEVFEGVALTVKVDNIIFALYQIGIEHLAAEIYIVGKIVGLTALHSEKFISGRNSDGVVGKYGNSRNCSEHQNSQNNRQYFFHCAVSSEIVYIFLMGNLNKFPLVNILPQHVIIVKSFLYKTAKMF